VFGDEGSTEVTGQTQEKGLLDRWYGVAGLDETFGQRFKDLQGLRIPR